MRLSHYAITSSSLSSQAHNWMTISIFIVAAAVFLSGAVIGVLAILVAGIRSDDRGRNLTCPSRTRTEAVTRRLLGVGVRGTEAGSEHHDDHP
jgi:hypothetical protein